jgi:hypothetical protein
MKTTYAKVIAATVLISAGFSSQASISETDGLGTTFLGSPTYLVAPGANSTTQFNVNEGNFGSTGGSGGFGALSQSFVLSPAQAASGSLSSIQLILAGAPTTFNVELYDLGVYPGSGYPSTSATYTPGSLTDLLQAGDSFTYSGAAGGAANVVNLSFSGADASFTFAANELYVFQIDPTSASAVQWARGNPGGPGEMYRMNQFSAGNMGALNGATRDGSFALTLAPTPEPSSLALLGLGVAGLGAMIRRKK